MRRTPSKPLPIILILLSILLQACGAAGSQSEATPEPVKLKVIVLPYVSYAPFFIAQDDGYFSEQGLEVEFIRLDKTAEAIPALAQGQVDVAAGLMEVSTLNAIAKGSKIKYVADKGYIPPDHCTFTGWVARKDLITSGALEDLSNLAGKKIAASPTSSAEYALDLLLKDVGLTSADVELLDMPPPARHEGLSSGSVEISAAAEPWITQAVSAGIGESWIPWESYMPNFIISIIMYGPNLLEKNPDAGNRFMLAYLNAVQQYNEGKTDHNVEIVAKYTQLPPEAVKATCWIAIEPDGLIDTQQVLDFQEWALAKGYIEERISVEQFWDRKFVDYAQEKVNRVK